MLRKLKPRKNTCYTVSTIHTEFLCGTAAVKVKFERILQCIIHYQVEYTNYFPTALFKDKMHAQQTYSKIPQKFHVSSLHLPKVMLQLIIFRKKFCNCAIVHKNTSNPSNCTFIGMAILE